MLSPSREISGGCDSIMDNVMFIKADEVLKCTCLVVLFLFCFVLCKFLALCWKAVTAFVQECLVSLSHNPRSPCRIVCIKHHARGGEILPGLAAPQLRLPDLRVTRSPPLPENWGGTRGIKACRRYKHR